MINRVVLVGRLTKDPELKYTPSGAAVVRFVLAVNRTFANQQGEKQADFINVVVWRKQAENAANYLHKGHLAGVEGRIQTGSYEGQDGKRVFTTEIVADSVQFLESRRTTQDAPGQRETPQTYTNQSQQQNNYGTTPSQNNYQQNQPAYVRREESFVETKTLEDDLPF